MGADAIIVSSKKKLYCDIDREYNFRYYGKDDQFQEEGISPADAIEIGEYYLNNPDKELGRYNDYMTKKGLAFLRTLDKDDIVRLVSDEGMGDEYMEIICGPQWWKGDIANDTEYREWNEYNE
jgi:hypothetical protein